MLAYVAHEPDGERQAVLSYEGGGGGFVVDRKGGADPAEGPAPRPDCLSLVCKIRARGFPPAACHLVATGLAARDALMNYLVSGLSGRDQGSAPPLAAVLDPLLAGAENFI
jgi:hypothetical protein